MRILLVFASDLECSYFKMEKNMSHTIKTLISGVGVFSTIYSLTKYIYTSGAPDVIIHAGICGSFGTFPIGSTVHVRSEVFGDVGVIENNSFKSIFDMNLINPEAFPFTHGELLSSDLDIHFLPQARSVTVNTISSTEEQIRLLHNAYNPDIETMEGAAVHYVALRERVPFIHIRTVSNNVGERNKLLWDIDGACRNMNKEINRIIHTVL